MTKGSFAKGMVIVIAISIAFGLATMWKTLSFMNSNAFEETLHQVKDYMEQVGDCVSFSDPDADIFSWRFIETTGGNSMYLTKISFYLTFKCDGRIERRKVSIDYALGMPQLKAVEVVS